MTWPCRHTPFRGFQNVREARPITTQNPSVGLYRFATAFPGHREHVALQRHPVPLPGHVAIFYLPPPRTRCPAAAALCHCLPRSPRTCCPAAAVLCQRVAMSPYSISKVSKRARSTVHHDTKPSVGLYRFAAAFPGHREHVALQRQPFATAWLVAILHLEGLEGNKTYAKHGPSGHKTLLWAFTALPLPSQVTANTLPCTGSPLPAPGHVAILHLEGFKTCAKHGPSRLWAFTALPLPFQVTAHTHTRCPAAAALCQCLAMSP